MKEWLCFFSSLFYPLINGVVAGLSLPIKLFDRAIHFCCTCCWFYKLASWERKGSIGWMCSTSSMDETILFLRLIFVLVNTYRFQIPFLFSFKEKMKSDMKLCLPPCLLKLVWNNPLEHPVLENVKKLSFSFPVFSSLLFPENLINVLSWNSWNENENENENLRLKTPKENSFSETTPSRPFWDQCSIGDLFGFAAIMECQTRNWPITCIDLP